MITCKFCKNFVSALHSKSHIVPEWMHDEIYDYKNRAVALSFRDTKLRTTQSGLYKKYLCCKDCEIQFARDDQYASWILTDKSPDNPHLLSLRKEVYVRKGLLGLPAGVNWSRFSFKKLQNFIFGVVLRQDLADQSEGRTLLGEKHFEKMRDIYLSSELLDDDSYPIIVVECPKDDPYRSNVFLPYHYKWRDHRAVVFCGAGYIFYTLVSSHAKPPDVELIKMRKSGEIIVLNELMQNTGVFKDALPAIGELHKKYPNVKIPE